MALANMGFKDQNWSHLGEEETVERERGESKRREEEEEEEDGEAKQAKVWNFGFLVWKPTLIMNSMRFGMYLWALYD